MRRQGIVMLVLAMLLGAARPAAAQGTTPIPTALLVAVIDSLAPAGPVVVAVAPLCATNYSGCAGLVPDLARFGPWPAELPERIRLVPDPTDGAFRARLDALGCGERTACTAVGLGPVTERTADEVVVVVELERLEAPADRLMDVTGYEVTLGWSDGSWRVAAS